MNISVVICTYNRSHYLKNALMSLLDQTVPEGLKWEIVVVDNNSSDGTFQIVKDFGNNSKIAVRYVKEEKQGLSYARNKGINESLGTYVTFIDDDGIVDKKWLYALYYTFKNNTVDCVGGKIFLKFNSKRPKWLKQELWGFLGFLDHGDTAFEVKDERIFGGNMAFSRDILNRVGLFNTDLGRTPHALRGGEEFELIERIKNTDGKIFYQPAALVYHVIGHEKLKKTYFRKLHYEEGIINGKFYNEPVKRRIKGIPLFIISHLLKSIVKYFKNPTLRKQMNVFYFLGFIKGSMLKHAVLKKILANN